MGTQTGYRYEFGPFRLDAGARLLVREGEPVPLTPKAVETLIALVESGGRVVGREELLKRVWPDTYVEENNLSVNVSMLRKALGQTTEGRPYIETLPRRGYRFAAEVRQVAGDGTGLVVERGVRERVVVIEEERDGGPSAGRPEVESESDGQPPRTLVGRRRIRGRAALVTAAALIAVGAAGLFSYLRPRGGLRRAAPTTAIKSLAVLPLRPFGPSEQSENYLGVGLADALITRLGSLGEVSVRPTSAVLRYDRPEQDSLAAARTLGVDAVLEGSYQREGGRIRVSVQLVGARDGTQLWSGAFDDKFTNIFALQDSVSLHVSRALVSNLDEAGERLLARRPTENVEAYRLYLLGRYFWAKRSTEGLRRALQHFEQAIRIDPQYARAYSGLADCYLGLSEHGELPRAAAYEQAVAAARRAVALTRELPEAHTTLGFIHLSRERDYANAEREFRLAIELNPGDATARQFYGVHLLAIGRKEEALAETRRALEIDPLSLLNNTQFARALYLAGRFDEAIEQSLKTLEMDQSSASARVYLGQSYAQKGMLREATAELEKAVELSGGRPEMKAALGHAYALSGRRGEAQKLIDELSALDRDFFSTSYHVATIYAGFPEKEQAFAWLQKAYYERDIFLGVRLKADPKLDSLRPDPRFAELIRKVGLPQ